jgi:hypothetical protein
MTGRAEIESEAFVQWGGEVFGKEGLVSLKDLSDRLHRIIVQIVLLDFRRVEARIGFDLDHVPAVAGSAQVLSAEIAREVDHQRFIPLIDETVIESEKRILTRF